MTRRSTPQSLVGATAMEIAALVRDGAASPGEVAEAHLERIEEMDGKIGAFAVVRGEKALAEARDLAARSDLAELPLAGVPVAIKDSVDVAGEPTRHGSRATPETPVAQDDELVRRLRAAGCIVIGKTRLPELSIWPFTETALHGITRNPWNPERTPGGSTGGGAAAVAAGMAPIAQASDGGGSIRIPAACCGLFGIKPGPRIVPVAGGLDEHWYGLSAWGPLATTVADAALMLDVMANTTTYRDVQPPAKPLRVALSLKSPALGTGADGQTREAVMASAEALRGAGHRVVEADPPYPFNLALLFMHRWLAGTAQDTERLRFDALEPRTQTMARLGRLLRRYLPVTPRATNAWRDRVTAWFLSYDVLLTPTLAYPAVPAGQWRGNGFLRTMLGVTPWVPYLQAWNLAGLPCASVPAGLSREGLPLAVQVIAPPGYERLILSVAAQLEQLRPWPRQAP